ncbi:MAG: 16S rRNA (cytosine(1402)-N(4))-methyltransferase RsmH [Saprospiraceae bacterium]
MTAYHVPVLLKESVEALQIHPDGKYVDMTFGSGGHSKSILKTLSAKGHLFAADQDKDALRNIIDDPRFTLINANFKYVGRFLKWYNVVEVDGILADLGVSSHQFDFPERGFSYRFDAPLDMRMNVESDLTAKDVLATYPEEKLVEIFSRYGEVRNTKQLARTLVKIRKSVSIPTTFALNNVLNSVCIGPSLKYFSQVYQALRMEVNDEINVLREMLLQAAKVLKKGGRFVVITYHSIEDREVKNFFKTGNFDGVQIKDGYGHIQRPFELVGKNIITPEAEELKENPRSRSAKLRVVQKK